MSLTVEEEKALLASWLTKLRDPHGRRTRAEYPLLTREELLEVDDMCKRHGITRTTAAQVIALRRSVAKNE